MGIQCSFSRKVLRGDDGVPREQVLQQSSEQRLDDELGVPIRRQLQLQMWGPSKRKWGSHESCVCIVGNAGVRRRA